MTLADQLRRALDEGATSGAELLPGDFPDKHDESGRALTDAAVLVAVTDRARPGVILTQRSPHLRRHAGQVAFPGGRIDPEDDGPVAAALREAEEEVALPRGLVEVVGIADRYTTGTGFDITPVLAVVPADLVLVPAEAEVAAVFEVPLDHLLNVANHIPHAGQWNGQMRHYYEIGWEDRRVWGATAAMIVNLSRRLRWRA